jgi:hypothetical protein
MIVFLFFVSITQDILAGVHFVCRTVGPLASKNIGALAFTPTDSSSSPSPPPAPLFLVRSRSLTKKMNVSASAVSTPLRSKALAEFLLTIDVPLNVVVCMIAWKNAQAQAFAHSVNTLVTALQSTTQNLTWHFLLLDLGSLLRSVWAPSTRSDGPHYSHLLSGCSDSSAQAVRQSIAALVRVLVSLLRSATAHVSTLTLVVDACSFMFRAADDLSTLHGSGLLSALAALFGQGASGLDAAWLALRTRSLGLFVSISTLVLWWHDEGIPTSTAPLERPCVCVHTCVGFL